MESIVLLKNDGALPLKETRVALFGAGGRKTISGGSGSGEVNGRYRVSVEEGLEEKDLSITTKAWLDSYDIQWEREKAAFIAENKKQLLRLSEKTLAALMAAEFIYPDGREIEQSELTKSGTSAGIYVLSRQSGEGHDRKHHPGDYQLTETERKNILRCAAHYETFILVLNTGGPIELTELTEHEQVNAIVYMGQLGIRALKSPRTATGMRI